MVSWQGDKRGINLLSRSIINVTTLVFLSIGWSRLSTEYDLYHHLPMVSAIVKVHKLPWTSLENGHRTNKAFCDTTVNLFQQLQSQTNNGILKKVMYTFCHVIHGPNITWPKFVKNENFGQQYTWKFYSSFFSYKTHSA